MNHFLEDVARYLFELNHGDFRNTLVVFPNRRARLFFNKYISFQTDKPLWAPKYYSISELIHKLSGLQLADQLTLIFHLFKVFKEVTKSDESFDSFYHYSEIILSDFDEVDKNCIDATMLYKNLGDLKEFDNQYDYLNEEQINLIRQFWEIFTAARNSSEKDQFGVFWNALKEIYIRFNALLEKEGIAYEGKAYRKVAGLIKEGKLPHADNQVIAFVGFNVLNLSEEIIFDYFKKTGKALFFWDYHESYIDGNIHEAGLFLRKYIKQFPQPAGFKSKNNYEDSGADIISFSVPSNISQAKIIDRCLNECISENNDDPGQTAIILADESLLIPVITSLPAEIGNINISMGYPVVDTPAFNFIVLLAEMQGRTKQTSHEEKFLIYHKDFFNILDHQYLIPIARTPEFDNFKAISKEKNLVYIDPSAFKSDNELYHKIFTRFNNPKQFGKYLLDILQFVAVSFTEKKELSKEEKWHLEVLYSFYKVLMRFEAMLNDQEIDLSLTTAFRLLKKILNGITVPFSGEPLTGIQILGILETRTLNFKNIIFLSMNEGKFPCSIRHNSFIPYSLREGFGMHTIKHQDAIYAYYFYRLLHRARKIILVHNTKSEGLQKGEPSRYILQLKYDSGFPINEINLGYGVSPIKTFKISASNSQEVTNKLATYFLPGGKNILAASALNTYLNCRLKFFYKYIKGLEEPESVDENIENNVFGSIIHKTIKLLYEGYENKTINCNQIESILENHKHISDCINQAFAEEYFHKQEIEEGDLRGRNLLVRKVIEKYITGILKYDKTSAPFHIIALEKKFTLEFSFSDQFDKITLGGYIDRLDRKDDCLRIIDYKTGKVKDRFEGIDSLFDELPSKRNEAAFQTFFYSLILEKDYNGQKLLPSLFFLKNIHKPDFQYKIRMKNEAIEDFKLYSDHFTERLNKLLEEFFDPRVKYVQTEDTKYCSYCPYDLICRRRS